MQQLACWICDAIQIGVFFGCVWFGPNWGYILFLQPLPQVLIISKLQAQLTLVCCDVPKEDELLMRGTYIWGERVGRFLLPDWAVSIKIFSQGAEAVTRGINQ